jgi:predicted nucleic acid-binding Zn ribbon protein
MTRRERGGDAGFADRRRKAGACDGVNERDEPRPLRDALADVSADLGLPDPDALGTLITRWKDVVGGDLAAYCRLRSLRDGVLCVTVDTAPRATQLRYLESDVVKQASALVGPDVVRSVQVRIDA